MKWLFKWAFRLALVHMSINLAVTAAYAVGFVVRAGHQSGPVGWGPLVLSAVALVALSVSGYLGGELAYRYNEAFTWDAAARTSTPDHRKFNVF